MQIHIGTLAGASADALSTEMVERKGIGHPDTVCDAVAEHVSNALARFYRERFGAVLHYNIDKALLWAGSARPAFGGGEVLAPMEFFLAGRATSEHKGVSVPIEALVEESVRGWIGRHLRYCDVARDIRVHSLVRPASRDLADLYLRQYRTGVALANDTSFGAGYAPLDELERLVLHVERGLNSPSVKRTHPEIGEDIKVMGVRANDHVEITLACAFVDRYVRGMADYREKKAGLAALAQQFAGEISSSPVEVNANAADGDTEASIYMTVTGTSAEAGDDGQAGRGNRTNGLITPYRPMTLEGAAGKNPVSHVGKLYNLAARRAAETMTQELPGVAEAYCFLVSQIGRPVDEPRVADVQLRLRHGESLRAIERRVEAIVRAELAGLRTLWVEIISGEHAIY